MIFIIYAEAKKNSIGSMLGASDYSYYFVLQQFKPVLESLGTVIEVDQIYPFVDRIFKTASVLGQPCIFLSFTPPHKTPNDLLCPTLPVFAWEFSTIPCEVWADDPRNNWANELLKHPAAITHCRYTCETVRSQVGNDYFIESIPSPLWDEYSAYYDDHALPQLGKPTKLKLHGWLVDSEDFDRCLELKNSPKSDHEISLQGVIYTSVLNPMDDRKNWEDILSAFCWAFKDNPNATLILKVTHSDPAVTFDLLGEGIRKLRPFTCRVLVIQGYLADSEYAALMAVTTFAVNASRGEGQCLPLMEFMSAGKPAIAPCHSGMLDYVTAENAYIVASNLEWTHWPHDLRKLLKTCWNTINWESLHECYLISYQEAVNDPEAYRARCRQAHTDLQKHCSQRVASKAVSQVVQYCEKRGVISPSRNCTVMAANGLLIKVFSSAMGLWFRLGPRLRRLGGSLLRKLNLRQ